MMAEKVKDLHADKNQFEKAMMEATDDHANNVEMLSSQISKLSLSSKAEQQNMIDKVSGLHKHANSTKAQNWWMTALQLHLKKLVIQKMKDQN